MPSSLALSNIRNSTFAERTPLSKSGEIVSCKHARRLKVGTAIVRSGSLKFLDLFLCFCCYQLALTCNTSHLRSNKVDLRVTNAWIDADEQGTIHDRVGA